MRSLLAFAVLTASLSASAQLMAPKPAEHASPQTNFPYKDELYVAKNFHFRDGGTLPELKLHYLTLGTPHRNAAGKVDNAVLVLHGTGGNRFTLTTPVFANELFAAGQPLDASKYLLILPDDIGQGDSSKPSDGLHMRFPKYDYDDMVRSQYQMLMDGLHVDHLRLIIGTSMGCMQAFVWGEMYEGFADALMPLACLPTELAGRNRMMRYMAIQDIKLDPAWKNGDYTTEPTDGLRAATELTFVMGTAPLVQQKAAPTRKAAEAFVDSYIPRALANSDANDLIYYFDASRNYNPEANLSKITVPVMYINSADDFINPPELGIAEKLAPKMPHAKFVLLPISDLTRGHGTHTQAVIWKKYLVELLAASAPKL
ncbi:MAG: alpha/beta fold hydrolase [Janthinobacterium lividum]